MTMNINPSMQQHITYEGNNINYYPYFDFAPTGQEPDIIEQTNVEVLIYDGGNGSGWIEQK